MYLYKFFPYSEDRRVYPYRVVYPMLLDCIDFAPITILYGNNGSGKSTLLNVIAQSIGIENMSLGNDNTYFEGYVKKCSFEGELPEDNALIRSEDIMVEISRKRKLYDSLKREVLRESARRLEDYGFSKALIHKALRDPEQLDEKDYAHISRISDFQDAQSALETDDMASNGEKALKYFQEHLLDEALYLLDELENSMAPAFQQRFAKHIELLAYRLNTQFVIATHSPFLLSIHGAKVYDLDARPSKERAWYELENMKAYYSLFKQFEDRFISE